MIHNFKSFNEDNSKNVISKMTEELAKEMFTYLDTEGEHALVRKYKNVVTDTDISSVIGAWATSNTPLDQTIEEYWTRHAKIYRLS